MNDCLNVDYLNLRFREGDLWKFPTGLLKNLECLSLSLASAKANVAFKCQFCGFIRAFCLSQKLYVNFEANEPPPPPINLLTILA